jgi:ferritin-like metal-binding protein YciE
MHHMKNLRDLLVHELQDLYSAEQQIVAALPKMANAADSKELKKAFEKHLSQTRMHVDRLDNIFSMLGASSDGHKCRGMEGLIKEGEEILQMQGNAAVKDAALIAAAQRIEHYEMAGYGTARTYADQLDHDEIADLLQETLDEEGKTNKMLTKLAEGGLLKSGINEEAVRA